MSSPDRRTLIADTVINTVAAHGLRGLTHRAVDTAAGLPPGSTSYYFRTRTALINAGYLRMVELDLTDLEGAAGGEPEPRGPAGSAADTLAALLHHWLTTARERQLARFELSLEAARQPDLRPALHAAGLAARARAATLLSGVGADAPEAAAELLLAWIDGLLYDRLAGALAQSRPEPDRTELTAVAGIMIDAALRAQPDRGSTQGP
ncbi:TetR/AcrR family transcriptional regulator [Streptomyces sparsus]